MSTAPTTFTSKSQKDHYLDIIRGVKHRLKLLRDADFPIEWGDTIPDFAFTGRHDISMVILPDRIKKIGVLAFKSCINLKTCVIPPGTKVGECAFYNCPKLEASTVLDEADFPEEWGDTIPPHAFNDRNDVLKVIIPLRFKKIGREAFSCCLNLEECILPPMIEVGECAFVICPKLQASTVLDEADFPEEWGDTIPPYAFKNRLDVVKVNIPSRITKIDEYAFKDCKNLEEFVILQRFTEHKQKQFKTNSFSGCTKLDLGFLIN